MKLPGGWLPTGQENISSTFKSATSFSRRESSLALACRVCRRCAFAESSGSAFSYPPNLHCPTTNLSTPSRSSTLHARLLSPVWSGIGFGFSSFCRWPRVFFSRVSLGLKYEFPQRHFRHGSEAPFRLSRISGALSALPSSQPCLCWAGCRVRCSFLVLDALCSVPLFRVRVFRLAVPPNIPHLAA